MALLATHAVNCNKATVVWPAREATSNVANGSHTIYFSVVESTQKIVILCTLQ